MLYGVRFSGKITRGNKKTLRYIGITVDVTESGFFLDFSGKQVNASTGFS